MPRYLTDTHVLMWWWKDDQRLSSTVREILADRGNEVFAPTVCAWEIANKVRIGKLPEMAEEIHDYDQLVTDEGFAHLDLRQEQALSAGLLPGPHRDPFDRLIAAQALSEKLIVLTVDPAFAGFGCKVLW